MTVTTVDRRRAGERFSDRLAKILVAEDSRVNQQVVLGMLEQWGLSADMANDGAEAVSALEAVPYNLVFMDLHMTGMNGVQATCWIRDERSHVLAHNIPIIAMTARDTDRDRAECLRAGMNGYLTKPIEPDALAQTLDLWLPRANDRGLRQREPAETVRREVETAASVETPRWHREGLSRRLANDQELVRAVVAGFLDDCPGHIETLRRSVDADDLPEAKSRSHLIKGLAATLGGNQLRDTALRMETAAASGDGRTLRADMETLSRQFEALKDEMVAFLENPRAGK